MRTGIGSFDFMDTARDLELASVEVAAMDRGWT